MAKYFLLVFKKFMQKCNIFLRFCWRNLLDRAIDTRFVPFQVLEHVSDQRLFLRSCCRLAFPGGGSVFVTTLNRTRQSYLFGVVAAESVLGLLPAGTHDWRKFVTPAELQEMLEEEGKCR